MVRRSGPFFFSYVPFVSVGAKLTSIHDAAQSSPRRQGSRYRTHPCAGRMLQAARQSVLKTAQ
jgi:hypothetical protein